jgi:protein involved in polysaccharide export with SLBB domain
MFKALLKSRCITDARRPRPVPELTFYGYYGKPITLILRIASLALISVLGGIVLLFPATAQVPAAPLPPAPTAAPSHILAPHEVIEIKVFQEPDLTTSTRIPANGRITFPLIGEVVVGGKSVQEVTQTIHERLEARFLVNPQVSVAVLEQAQRIFTVLGQVQRPGTYRFPERQSLDLLQVIGIAGGYTRLADPGKITIKRQKQGGENVVRVDGKRLASNQNAAAVAIESGDLITVGERLF